MLGLTLSFVLMVSAATGIGIGISGDNAQAASGFDQSWQDEGFRFHFVSEDSDSNTFEWDVAVHDTSNSELTFDWIVTSGGEKRVQQATYDADTRESTAASGQYSYLWINWENVESGEAWIGDELAILVSSLDTYEFSVDGKNYRFDKDTGYLVQAENTNTGSVITLDSTASDASLPSPDNDNTEMVGIETDGTSQVIDTTTDNRLTDSVADQTHKELICNGDTGFVVGGTDHCSQKFEVSGDFKHGATFRFPFLGSGSMQETLSDAGGDYYIAICTSQVPVIFSSQIDCGDTVIRTIVVTGTHTFDADVSFDFCLNPLTLFSCPWEIVVNLQGDAREKSVPTAP